MAKTKGAQGRHVKHSYNDHPPQAQRFVVNDDNWGLAETQLPINHEKINPNAGDPQAMAGKYGRPVHDDNDAFAIHHSTSDGKR